MNRSFENSGEQIGQRLGKLYRDFGYTQYKMSKFEEYDLYANHKDFLLSDQIITFTDLSGKLMALKPDVTLSIVRNSRDEIGVKKVYYTENVYRPARGGHSFKEILQTGLECIGAVDDYCIAEALILAAKSLRAISNDSILEISNLDILSAQLDLLNVNLSQRRQILKCISGKNLHELEAVCTEAGAVPERVEELKSIIGMRGTAEEILPQLCTLPHVAAAAQQLRRLAAAVSSAGFGDMLRMDLSIVSDMSYYNGVVFHGFVSGIPTGVLTGGQYDRLMLKMGRRASAIGFAVYLDELEHMCGDSGRFDVDTVLLYDENADILAVSAAVSALTEQVGSVSAQTAVPEKLRYRQLLKLNGSEVEILETNA